MRVLVCGGRKYTNREHIHNTLCDIDAERGPITRVIHGGATGADDEAIKHIPFVAEWHKHGRAAGPIRNKRMLEEGKPDLVVAFPGGKGTANMVKIAESAGVEVIKIEAK